MNDIRDYQWRAAFYAVEEEDLGDLAYYSRWLLGIEGPALVVPSGAGRLVPLAQSRLNLYFCDIEPAMVRLLRNRLSATGLSAHLGFQGDMFNLPTQSSYEAIIVPAEAAQMYCPELLRQILAGLHAVLKPLGSIVLDLATFDPRGCNDPEAPGYFRPDISTTGDWRQWRRQLPNGNWVTRDVAHLDNGTCVDFTFTYTVESPEAQANKRTTNLRLWRYNRAEMVDLAGEVGFRCERCETSYTTLGLNQGARLIFTLKKYGER
jgi:SAM-dependent methyltransferase